MRTIKNSHTGGSACIFPKNRLQGSIMPNSKYTLISLKTITEIAGLYSNEEFESNLQNVIRICSVITIRVAG